jgi:hypothetical protein
VSTFVVSATTFETISGTLAIATPYDSHSTKPTKRTPRYATDTVRGRAAHRDATQLEERRQAHRDAARGGCEGKHVVGLKSDLRRRQGRPAAGGQSRRSPRSRSSPYSGWRPGARMRTTVPIIGAKLI